MPIDPPRSSDPYPGPGAGSGHLLFAFSDQYRIDSRLQRHYFTLHTFPCLILRSSPDLHAES